LLLWGGGGGRGGGNKLSSQNYISRFSLFRNLHPFITFGWKLLCLYKIQHPSKYYAVAKGREAKLSARERGSMSYLPTLIKKKIKFSSYTYKEIQDREVAKSYTNNGLLKYG
jgi:hypothetical protein